MKKTGTFLLKRDNLQLGLVLGFVLPLLVVVVIYLVSSFREIPFDEFLQDFAAKKTQITFFGVWCVVANIALFTYYVNTQRDRTAKGIFAVTLVYGLGILLAKVLI